MKTLKLDSKLAAIWEIQCPNHLNITHDSVLNKPDTPEQTIVLGDRFSVVVNLERVRVIYSRGSKRPQEFVKSDMQVGRSYELDDLSVNFYVNLKKK